MINLTPKYSRFVNVVVLPDGFIILEEWRPGKDDHDYLYKLDLSGNLLWQTRHPDYQHHHFYDIELRDKKLILFEGTGEVEVNPKTGELTNWLMTK